jgi:hypothetical protein
MHSEDVTAVQATGLRKRQLSFEQMERLQICL